MQEFTLNPFDDYRIETSNTDIFRVMLVEGNAEILGIELLSEKWYTFTNQKVSIYTLKGAKLKTEGTCTLSFVSTESNIKETFEFFANNKFSKVVICGPGKISFARILVSLFVRSRQKVILAEFDPKSGQLCFSGVLGCALVESIGFDFNNVLCYFYGQEEIVEDGLYEKLFEIICKDAKKDSEIPIIAISPDSEKWAERLYTELNADFLAVIGDERRFHSLKIEKKILIKRGFVAEDDQAKRIRNYFYGSDNELTPFGLNLSNHTIYTKRSELLAPETALPLGVARRTKSYDVEECEFEENKIMAIVEDSPEKIDLLLSPVVGFLVALEKENKKILGPQQRLPKEKNLIKGEIKYFEM